MNADQWKRLKALREAALELEGSQRDAFLSEQCGDDHELLAELRRLLGDTEVPEDFLNPPNLEQVVNKNWASPQFLGEYELVSEIGRGGVGVVFLAEQAGLDRKVAVKALPPYVTRSQRDVDRFQREGHAVSLLNHPGIVSIYAVGQDADTPYFAMEYVEGRSLFEELCILRGEGERGKTPFLSSFDSREYLAQAVSLCIEVCEALQYAHDQGVVHRDVKPQNLLLDTSGKPLLADFGLARVEEYGTISRSGDVLGTVHYMSPEQARMVKANVDHRTDVYSMGVVLYEMLTLVRPFEGTSSAEVLHQIAWEDPVSVRTRNPAVAHDLEIICEGAITKDPNRRYATAGELAADLTRFLNHQAIERKAPTTFEQAQVWMHANRKLIAAAVLLLVAIVAGAQGQQLLASKELAVRTHDELSAALAGFDDWTPQEVMAVLERAREQLGQDELGDEDHELMLQLEQRCAIRGQELRSKGKEALKNLLGPMDRTDLTTVDFGREPQLVEGVEALTSAAVLTGSVDELADDLVRLSTVSVTIQAKPSELAQNARVYIRSLDPYTDRLGELKDLGTIPLAPVQLAAGFYRIIVDQPGVGFAELKSWFPHRGGAYEVEAWLRPATGEDGRTPEGMVLVQATPYTIDLPNAQKSELQVEAFFVDKTLVTNAEYEEYLAFKGLSSEDFWGPLDERTPEWFAKPATRISVKDARGYAEWRGKRLLTHAEWEVAARGPEKLLYPWGNEFDRERFELFNVGRPDLFTEPKESPSGGSRGFRWYNKHVRAVAQVPEDCRGPNGLFGLLGNVWEWVDTTSVQQQPGELVVEPYSFYRAGGSCESRLNILEPRGLSLYIWGGTFPEVNTGFRCAKSVSFRDRSD